MANLICLRDLYENGNPFRACIFTQDKIYYVVQDKRPDKVIVLDDESHLHNLSGYYLTHNFIFIEEE